MMLIRVGVCYFTTKRQPWRYEMRMIASVTKSGRGHSIQLNSIAKRVCGLSRQECELCGFSCGLLASNVAWSDACIFKRRQKGREPGTWP